jgi:hypothetical protein
MQKLGTLRQARLFPGRFFPTFTARTHNLLLPYELAFKLFLIVKILAQYTVRLNSSRYPL